MQIPLTDAQGWALKDLLDENLDGEGVLLTAQSQGSVYVAFSLTSYTIDADGTVEEAG